MQLWRPEFDTHNHFTVLWILSGTTRVSLYQKKHSPTHTYRGHQLSLICFHPSTMIHGILPVQSMCLTVFFHNLSPSFLSLGLAPSTSYSIHFFTQSWSSFHNTCPYHCNLFSCSTKIMSSNPSLSHNPLFGTLSCTVTPHIHLTILIST